MEKKEKRRERHKKLEILLKLTAQINSDLDLNSVLFNIIEGVKEIAECEASSVFLLDEAKNELVLTIPSGPAGNLVAGKRIAVDEGISGWTAEHAEPLLVNDVTKDSRFHGDFDPSVFKTRNILSLPLQNKTGKVIGVIQAVNKFNEEGFSKDDIPLLKALANQAAFTISNAQLLNERNTLLSEVHHRVKNNMAIISGMMQIQAMSEENSDLKNKLLINIIRISAMAAVHEQLYKEAGFSRLNFTENLRNTIHSVISTMESSNEIKLSLDCDSVSLNINQALPLSMIVCELVFHIITNGISVEQFIIHIELKEDETGEQVALKISDNGHSVKDQVLMNSEDPSGFQLIDLMAQQMEADVEYISDENGNLFSLKFVKSDAGGSGNKFL